MDNDALELYNRELISLAREGEGAHHLTNPDATATAVSPVCGSVVTIDLNISEGMVAAMGYEAEACSLTKAVIAVLKKVAPGKTRDEIAQGHKALETMLEKGTLPSGDWAALSVLLPIRDYRARHGAVLLPFVAAERAFEKI